MSPRKTRIDPLTVSMTIDEARKIVDLYYQFQEHRKALGNQITESEKAEDLVESLKAYFVRFHDLEKEIKKDLDRFSMSNAMGQAVRSVDGIGPVIAAGLIAHIDITMAKYAGNVWSFAGLTNRKWEKGQKRPWNGALKTLCWKAGQSFMKRGDKSYYGKVYQERKALEVEENLSGANVETARAALEAKNFKKNTEAYQWYAGCLTAGDARKLLETPADKRMGQAKKLAGAPGSGQAMLPPAHIDARARRVAVKLFLSHYHHVAHVLHFGIEPPVPYVIEHLGHLDYVSPREAGWEYKP